jgi:ribosome biogenesis GTPase
VAVAEAEGTSPGESWGDDDASPEHVAAGAARNVPVEGIVVAITHGFVEVSVQDVTLLCTLRGRLRYAQAATAAGSRAERSGGRLAARPGRNLRAAPPEATETQRPTRLAPGDRVRVLPLDGGTGVIEEILPRRSALIRAAGEAGGGQIMLANLDHAALVFAVRDPAPHFGMLDRYLALCEHAGVEVTICLNKVDLGISPEVEAKVSFYGSLGYQVLETSAVTHEHMDALRVRLCCRVSLLSGSSGVGKSSLVNILIPDAGQRTSAVSEATGKGRHTTTGVRLLPLEDGGWLADSAGIRELALWNVSAEDLARCFVELRPVADDCLYADCSHGPEEEGCALRTALAEGRIMPERFASFERLLREARGEAPDS